MEQKLDNIAFEHLKTQYPELREYLQEVGVISLPPPRFDKLENAVISTIVGQMLSRKSAATIYRRLEARAKQKNLESLTHLEDQDLTACGLSQRKIKTIRSFEAYIRNNSEYAQKWEKMTYEDLLMNIKGEIYGFADWSISMIAIFHFNHVDVFPHADGTIKKALEKLQETMQGATPLMTSKAQPYSSYLALFLWAAIDQRVL